LKIEIATNRAAETETSEFLFNQAGQLIFNFERKEAVEKRFYFADESALKMMIADKQFTPTDEVREKVRKILLKKAQSRRRFSKFARLLIDPENFS
jgi:hypothetical protein